MFARSHEQASGTAAAAAAVTVGRLIRSDRVHKDGHRNLRMVPSPPLHGAKHMVLFGGTVNAKDGYFDAFMYVPVAVHFPRVSC